MTSPDPTRPIPTGTPHDPHYVVAMRGPAPTASGVATFAKLSWGLGSLLTLAFAPVVGVAMLVLLAAALGLSAYIRSLPPAA